MQIKITKEIILTEQEGKLVEECLKYVMHRKVEHNKPKNISTDKVSSLLEQFNEKQK